jgi:hypothetical protein
MSIDLTKEPGIRPAQAARLVPPLRDGRPTHPATIVRWIVDGCPDGRGGREFLEGARTPGGWITSTAALQRFLSRLTPDRAATARNRNATGQAMQAGRELERRGG